MVLVGGGCFQVTARISTFAECAAAGYPVMESFPRQCRAEGKTFVEAVAEQPQPAPEPAVTGTYDQQITLKIGGSAAFSDGLLVSLVRIDDSRCPKEAVCIWAGELSPVLKVENTLTGAVATNVTLGTVTRKEVSVGKYEFTLDSATESAASIVVSKK